MSYLNDEPGGQAGDKPMSAAERHVWAQFFVALMGLLGYAILCVCTSFWIATAVLMLVLCARLLDRKESP